MKPTIKFKAEKIPILMCFFMILFFPHLLYAADNIALNKPITASSDDGQGDLATYVNDGSFDSRWASGLQNDQWIQIDLEGLFDISRVKLHWEDAFATSYRIEVSYDAERWWPVALENNGDGGVDEFNNLNTSARYIRMWGLKRFTKWGFSLWEFEVFGTPALQSSTYEAEGANNSGTFIKSDNSASGGEYVYMESNATITWWVESNTEKTYNAKIGYRLPWGQKTQTLKINQGAQQNIVFDGSINTWLEKEIPITLQAGSNQIEISADWGYMDIDYLKIEGANTIKNYGWVGNDTVNFNNETWRTVCITFDASENCEGGKAEVVNGELRLTAGNSGRFGVFRESTISGHFEVSATVANTSLYNATPTGISLIPSEQGAPDIKTYTSLFSRKTQGLAHFSVNDRQPAPNSECLPVPNTYINDLRDGTCELSDEIQEKVYEARLTGEFGADSNDENHYNIPFTETTGSMRIFHDNYAGFFRYYYTVKKKILGESHYTEGERETAGSRSWQNNENAAYHFAILTEPHSSAITVVKNAEVNYLPMQDSGSTEQFTVEKRDFTWSGYTGDATVVSFESEFVSGKQQLVFWEHTNNVPVFKLNDQLLFSYEFVELWADNRMQNPGAFEPMSDDLRWRNTVEVTEDTPVRKVIYWRYPLINPAYETMSNRGDSVPMGEEWWTIYPDATVFRRVRYDTDPHATNEAHKDYEFSEFIVIAGTQTTPEDHAMDGNSVEFFSLSDTGPTMGFIPKKGENEGANQADGWKEVIMAANLRSSPVNGAAGPQIYAAYGNAEQRSDVSKSAKLSYDVTWHDYQFQFSHWPVGRMPFERHDKSFAFWTEEVSHSSLGSIQVHGDGKDPKDKEWVTLVGLEQPGQPKRLRDRTAAWLNPADLKDLDYCTQNGDFDKQSGTLRLKVEDNRCEFKWGPKDSGRTLIRPVLSLQNVGQGSVSVKIGEENIAPSLLRTSHVNGTTDIWINKEISSESTFEITIAND